MHRHFPCLMSTISNKPPKLVSPTLAFILIRKWRRAAFNHVSSDCIRVSGVRRECAKMHSASRKKAHIDISTRQLRFYAMNKLDTVIKKKTPPNKHSMIYKPDSDSLFPIK